MPDKAGQPGLVSFLASPLVNQAVKKGIFGGEYLRFYNFIEIMTQIYMTCATLGRANSADLRMLAKIATHDSDVESLKDWGNQDATTHLKQFVKDAGKMPETFFDLVLFEELEEASGIKKSEWFNNKQKIQKTASKTISLKDAGVFFNVCGMEGMGFGIKYPLLVKIMYENYYRSCYDNTGWRTEAADLGLVAFDEKLTLLTFEEYEKNVLRMYEEYTTQYYPELHKIGTTSQNKIIGREIMGSKGRKNVKKQKQVKEKPIQAKPKQEK